MAKSRFDIAIVGNDGRARALRWHFERCRHKVHVFGSARLLCIRPGTYDLVFLANIEDSANGLQEGLCAMFGKEKVFGVNRKGAEFEANKAYGLSVAKEYGLNVPKSLLVKTGNQADLQRMAREIKQSVPGEYCVIKKIGLECGKGVKVLRGSGELEIFLAKWGEKNPEGIVVQEYIEGIEVSGRVLCQQDQIIPLWMTFEHKRAHNDDRGAFTAEMGTVVVAGVGEPLMAEIRKLGPWLREVKYTGVLDINFIMDRGGKLWFVEPTCRWGDPETEIALPLLDCDFAQLAAKACRGEASKKDVFFACTSAVGVVIAGGGYPYPDACLQGMPIELPRESGQPYVFLMSAERKKGRWVTKGGRNLVVVATADTVEAAREKVYQKVRSNYWFLDAWYRTDIGAKWETQRPILKKYGVLE